MRSDGTMLDDGKKSWVGIRESLGGHVMHGVASAHATGMLFLRGFGRFLVGTSRTLSPRTVSLRLHIGFDRQRSL